jgi:membrane protease YdiL (CAAX protease family)
VDDPNAALPLTDSPAPSVALAAPDPLPRWFAALQIALVCGVPTQVVAAAALMLLAGMPLTIGGGISFEFVATLSLMDTAIVAVLIRIFLALSGETSAAVFLGTRRVRREVLYGLALLPVIFAAVIAIVLGLRSIAPWLHNVQKSPFENFMNSPLEAGIFLVVVVLAGGVREELQRAFILHRFEQRLGGAKLGLALFTVAFGMFHLDQGFDVAIAVGLLGLFWGLVYIRRRSIVAPMVNHAGFNAAQVAQIFLARSLGA